MFCTVDRFPQFKNLVPNVLELGAKLASKAQELDNFIASNLLTIGEFCEIPVPKWSDQGSVLCNNFEKSTKESIK